LEESVLSAIATRRQRALSLSQQIGAPEVFSADLVTSAEGPPEAPPVPVRAQAVQVALSTSPEVQELTSQLRSAQERLPIAGDAYRPRLDVEGYVQLAGAGDRTVAPVVQQIGRASATSVHLGLVYELPLDQSRKVADRAQALLTVRMAEEKLRAARQRTKLDIDSVSSKSRWLTTACPSPNRPRSGPRPSSTPSARGSRPVRGSRSTSGRRRTTSGKRSCAPYGRRWIFGNRSSRGST
jgi:hypothetical protein